MRKFSYQKQVAVIRTLKEPKIKKKKLNLDRVLYLLILATLVFLLINYLYNRIAWVEANGQVHMGKVDVNFTNDIRLQQLLIAEGDTVFDTQPLFSYNESQFSQGGTFLRETNEKLKSQKELQDLDMEIEMLKLTIAGNLQHIKLLERQEAQITRWVLLDVQTIDHLTAVQQQLVSAHSKLNRERGALQLLKNRRDQLELPNGSFGGMEALGGSYFESTYKSPINGIIGRINKNEKESCYRMENVMTIHNTDDVFIKGYFQLNDLDKVGEGKIVKIEFPDKSNHQGVISKVYIATYEAPKEFQKKYEPTERNILVEIKPLDATSSNVWGMYHKLNVKISLSNT